MSSHRPDDVRLPAALVLELRESVAAEHGVEQAFARFLLARAARKRSRFLDIALAFGAGMLVSIGSLYAASAFPWHSLGFGWQVEQAQRTPSAGAQRRAPVTATGAQGSAVPLSPSPELSLSASPSAPARPTHALPSEVASAASAQARESWLRAANGLRERDFDAANDALQKLSGQGTRAEREAARLVRAQLLLTQGKPAEAQVLLASLKNAAESPLVRRKAEELWGELQKSNPSQRSFEPAPNTNLP